MWSRARNVGAIFAGLAVVVGLMITSVTLISSFVPPASTAFLVLTLVTALLWHFGGGWLCAVLARDSRYATTGLIVLGTFLMLMTIRVHGASMPLTYSAIMLLIAPTGLWLGTRAHARRLWHAQQQAMDAGIRSVAAPPAPADKH